MRKLNIDMMTETSKNAKEGIKVNRLLRECIEKRIQNYFDSSNSFQIPNSPYFE
jgi:hypothetical protein